MQAELDVLNCSFLNFYFATIFVVKMCSAFYICCIYLRAHKLDFFMEANSVNPDQTAPLVRSGTL